jgi:hypothetical protein
MGGSVRILSVPEHWLKLYYFAACRIFLGGKDGCLYEFVYRAEKGWWGQRTQKINLSSGNLRWVTATRYRYLLTYFAPTCFTLRCDKTTISFRNFCMVLNERLFCVGAQLFCLV